MQEIIDFFWFHAVERPEQARPPVKLVYHFLRIMCAAGSILHMKNPPIGAGFVRIHFYFTMVLLRDAACEHPMHNW